MTYSIRWLLRGLMSAAILALFINSRPAQAHTVPCENGLAGENPCLNIDLLAHLSVDDLGGDEAGGVLVNDLWGWTSPTTGKEYVLIGLYDRTAFVDISQPEMPILVGDLPTVTPGVISLYRSMKTWGNYAFIVGDQPNQAHGMQVFDLTQLDNVTNPPVTFSESAHYDGVKWGHNIWINQASGYGYITRSDTCNASTHVVDLNDPLHPVFLGCMETDGADSDLECVIYAGPDSDYTGHEICVVGSDSSVTVADFTHPDMPVTVARITYPNVVRAHQGSFTGDQRYWLFSDIDDEHEYGFNTRTHLLDLNDLDAPVYLGYHEHATTSGDHNLYVIGHYVYEANWSAGLRVLDISDVTNLAWPEVAFFDTHPDDDFVGHHGAFGNYPRFASGVVAVSDAHHGLMLMHVDLAPTDVTLSRLDGRVAAGWQPWALMSGLLAGGVWLWRRRVGRLA